MDACQDLKNNLVLHAYGELNSGAGKEVENHLAMCECCRAEYRQLVSLLTSIKKSVSPPELPPEQVDSLVADIKSKLRSGARAKWWRRYPDYRPPHMIPAIAAAACLLIIAAGVIGYLRLNGTNLLQPFVRHQHETVMLSDKDLEIVENLELLKEMDAIQKLSRAVDPNSDINSQGEMENETRGMKQDAYRQYFV